MKKFLLGTTALFGAASLYAGAALAEGPEVIVGGFIDFQAGIADNDSEYEENAGEFSRDFKFQNDTEVHIQVRGEMDNGVVYGAVIELEADISGDGDGEGLNADKTFIFLESQYGRVEMGGNTDAAEALRVDASTFARATGGIDGDFDDFANVNNINTTPVPGAFFIDRPRLPTAFFDDQFAGVDGFANTQDATKITYYTPRWNGLQFGLSYTPDQGDSGSATGFTGENGFDYEDVINLGLQYSGQFDELGVAAAITGEFAENEDADTEDLEAYNLGLNLTYAGFSVGASYGDWQESYLAEDGDNGDSDYWTIGAGYEWGPAAFSITYLDSEFDGDEFENLSLGADYQLAPGLVPYIEVNFFDADVDESDEPDNDGTVVLIGTQLNF